MLAMSVGLSAFADELSEKEKQYENSQERMEELKEKIGELGAQILDGQNKVKILEGNIARVDMEIKTLQNQIKDMENKIDYATKELNLAIAKYNQQDKMMQKRINTMYKNGTTMGYLEALLSSESFADFVSRADIIKKVVDYDIETLKEMKAKRQEIDKKKAELEEDKSQLVAMKSSLDNKKAALVKQNQERKNLVALLSRQKSTYESDLKEEEAAAEKLMKEINALRSYKGSYDGNKWPILHKSDFPSGKTPRITSPFGYRTDPITGSKAYHSGLDIGTAGLTNIPVYAMAGGKVILSRYYGGYGYTVVIDHGSGLTTLYAHNNTLLVKEGDTIQGGTKIALSGSTGRSTGPHVHFGVAMKGEYIDPAPYYVLGP